MMRRTFLAIIAGGMVAAPWRAQCVDIKRHPSL
jgi:hypothetical protein